MGHTKKMNSLVRTNTARVREALPGDLHVLAEGITADHFPS